MALEITFETSFDESDITVLVRYVREVVADQMQAEVTPDADDAKNSPSGTP